MSLLMPDFGLFFWMMLSFGIVVFILVKFGFPAILQMIEKRRSYIEESLLEAENARKELEEIKTEAKKIQDEAFLNRKKILDETTEIKNALIKEAKEKAFIEAEKIMEEAKKQIRYEKMMALQEIKQQVAEISIAVSEKLLQSKLNDKPAQMEIINRMLEKMDIGKFGN
ncbi:MAG TPA: F0F1 ATP synthase subunit B [Paludibacteraceae bacterium]|nr:F0F1 ATP synthase subunit B [Paludibacteraceae bacterium]OPZ03085.1 MAG: ATP synthase subunit b [Bacteroidetes bacterium ADurb.BinA395]MBP8965844.1 F0F1 ATP synthase subunit B [Paludibacteraceae bacterium]HOF98912.1 F0F1 ATP synthase subunit B [Paludibacteraceae bacterium]HOJ65578.1 F0F1 ATP synthase subunit B [Paludibacteraceae bacterium]